MACKPGKPWVILLMKSLRGSHIKLQPAGQAIFWGDRLPFLIGFHVAAIRGSTGQFPGASMHINGNFGAVESAKKKRAKLAGRRRSALLEVGRDTFVVSEMRRIYTQEIS